MKIMKKQISSMAIGLAALLMINACQTPEQRAQDMNKESTVENATADNANTTSTTDSTTATMDNGTAMANDAAATTPNTDAAITKKKGTKGMASVDMKGSESKDSKMEMDKDGVYGRSEIMPSYPGGENSLSKFVEDNLQYPEKALDNGVEGRVLVSFDVDEAGKIYRPTVVSDKLGYGLEDEALRVIKSMPQWNPGKIKGKNVKTKFTLPIVYQII